MFQTDLLKQKCILITGGGTGLGRAMAERFLALGATVHICGRRAEVLQQAQEELRRISPRVYIHPCDVRQLPSVEAMLEAVWQQGALNVLVNNAAGNFLARTEELSPRAFEAVIGINLMGSIHLTLSCGKRWLAAQQSAVVLNIATTYWHTGSAFVVPSAVSKAGVVALTRSLAVEWGGRGIRLNAIAPGPFPTEGAFSRLLPSPQAEREARARVPLGRFGRPEELADLAAFLVSDASAYINGEVVTIDGGEWLRGAGEFSGLGESLGEAEWQSLRARSSGKPGKSGA